MIQVYFTSLFSLGPLHIRNELFIADKYVLLSLLHRVDEGI